MKIVTREYTHYIVSKIIGIVGSQSALAKACKVKQPHVYYWLNKADKVPAEQVDNMYNAAKQQVSKKEIRPDLF